VNRPRARTADGEREVELKTYAHFAARDRLTDVMLERMLLGVSTRRYARANEPVGSDVEENSQSTSKSAVGRAFVSRTRENLIELMSRPLEDLRLAIWMLDGIELKGRCCVVALGIDTDGVSTRSASGTALPRTPPSPPRCSPTSSTAASMSSRACSS
jgi:putative transposase